MSQVWGFSQPVTHSFTSAVKDVAQDEEESHSSSHPLLWSSGALHMAAKQGGCLPSFFPVTCEWDGLKHLRSHGLLNHSHSSQEKIGGPCINHAWKRQGAQSRSGTCWPQSQGHSVHQNQGGGPADICATTKHDCFLFFHLLGVNWPK